MPRRQGGSLSGFTPLSTPNAPTGLSVSGGIGGATVSFTAPTDTGDGAATSYIVTAINESTGASTGATGSASPITISPGGGTFKIRAQAVNGFGPGRLTEFSTGNVLWAGAEIYAWGIGSEGGLGDNTTISKSSPVQVGALTTWRQVSASNAVAALKTNNTLWMWATNSGGQLGVGDVYGKSSPVQVGSLTNWYQVDTGTFHTVAVKTNGTLWAWGNNSYGALGDGTETGKSSPVQIGLLATWLQVSGGRESSAAVKTDGTLWTWGKNNNGQLGDNTVVPKSSPIQVGALTTWSQARASNGFALARTSTGELYAWGQNSSGQLGDVTANNKSSPVQVAISSVAWISSSGTHVLAIKEDGTLWGWGSNSDGALGDGTVVSKSSPVQIGALTGWSLASAGGSSSSIAVKTDGTLWVWGNNSNGRLGDGTTVSKSSPVQLGALTTWIQPAAGGSNGFALLGVV